MGSHSITCHPIQVNTRALTPDRQHHCELVLIVLIKLMSDATTQQGRDLEDQGQGQGQDQVRGQIPTSHNKAETLRIKVKVKVKVNVKVTFKPYAKQQSRKLEIQGQGQVQGQLKHHTTLSRSVVVCWCTDADLTSSTDQCRQ